MLFLQRNDLQGVRVYSAVDLQGLYTLGTVVIDYRGYRVTAQSIIPGILEREQEQSVVYGSIDFGKTVISHPKYLELASNREMCVYSVMLTYRDIYLNNLN
jgi:protein TIF31